MGKTIDYYYSHISPWSFLGHARFLELVAETGTTVVYHPFSVSGVFPKTGGVPVNKRAPERQAYRMVELKRWSKHLDVPMNFQPKHFPVDDRPAQYLAMAALEAGLDIGALSGAILSAVWQEDRDVSDWQTLSEIASAQGLDAASLIAAAQNPEMEEKGVQANDAAVAAGVFGAPWYIVDGEGFWGQDRLPLLAEQLR